MRKKILMVIGTISLMAVILSLTAFAGIEEANNVTLTDHGVITVFFENFKLFFKFFFGFIDKIYVTVAGWFA